jgi:hypothetical protein
MRDHELDHILSEEDELVPSTGFVKSVMDGVRMEASAPPPIPFPWRRALPGLMVCLLALAAVCVTALSRPGPARVHEVSAQTTLTRLMSDLGLLLSAANIGGLGWIILALILTVASIKLSLRLKGSGI